MIEILRSVFLGIIQGLTEFLPVSSSAHLNVFPWLMGWEITESFDLALHAGTLIAILVYFFKDWVALVKGGVLSVARGKRSTEGRLFWYIVIATIPAGLLGKLMEKGVNKLIGVNLNIEMTVIALALIIMGVLLYIVDKRSKSDINLKEMTFKQAFFIGLSQSIAGAIPGVSRSGITMTTARAYGVNRESAAKFSFLLSAPMVAGAVLLSLKEFQFSAAFFAGVAASFISGFLVIKFLMNYLKRGSYGVFALYRVVFGIIIIAVAAIRMI